MTNEPFQTMQEVDDYLSGNVIVCLVCGKRLQRLNIHLQKTHNITPDEYRRQFGIPSTRSLTSAPSRAKSGAAMTPERIEALKRLGTHNNPAIRRGTWLRGRVPAVADLWKKSAETGRYFSRKLVIAKCAKCSCDIAVTALGATQTSRCYNCTSYEAKKARRHYWRQKWAA